MRERHNSILQCLVRAIPSEGKNIFVVQAISPDALRPDIVLVDQTTNNATIVDVTIPYESGTEAFNKARRKSTKIRWAKSLDEGTTIL